MRLIPGSEEKVQKTITRNSSPRRGSRTPFFPPPLGAHALLYAIPNALDDLTVAPAALHAHMGVPLLDLGGSDAAAPAAHGGRHVVATPAEVDAQQVPEQLGWALPLVPAELPRLARGEDGHHPTPVVRFELLRRVHEDEAQRARWVD